MATRSASPFIVTSSFTTSTSGSIRTAARAIALSLPPLQLIQARRALIDETLICVPRDAQACAVDAAIRKDCAPAHAQDGFSFRLSAEWVKGTSWGQVLRTRTD